MSRFKKVFLTVVTLTASAAIWWWFPPQPRAVIRGVENYSPIVFSPDSRFLATQGLKFWDVLSGQEEFALGPGTDWSPVAISSDNRLVIGEKETWRYGLWDLVSGQEKPGFEEFFRHSHRPSFSSNGHWVAGTQQERDWYHLWDVEANQKLAILGERVLETEPWSPQKFNFALGGKVFHYRVAGKSCWWDTTTRKAKAWPPETEAVSQDGRTLVVRKKESLELLEEGSSRILHKFPKVGNNDLPILATLSPDGSYVAISITFDLNGKSLEVWSTATGKKVFDCGNVLRSSFSPDGRFFECENREIPGISIWEVGPDSFHKIFWTVGTQWASHGSEPREESRFISPDALPVHSILSPDFRYVAIGYFATAPVASHWTKVVDVFGEKCLATLYHCTDPQFSSDSKTLLTRSPSGTIQLWDVPPKKPWWPRLGLAALPWALVGGIVGWRWLAPKKLEGRKK